MTTYDEVFEAFLRKIEDYDILEKFSENIELGKDLLTDFLLSAIPKFTYATVPLIDRNNEASVFNFILSDLEIEILANLMVVEYLSPKVLRNELLETYMGSKDYKTYSPANLLNSIKELRETYKREANSLMLEYYYRQGV